MSKQELRAKLALFKEMCDSLRKKQRHHQVQVGRAVMESKRRAVQQCRKAEDLRRALYELQKACEDAKQRMPYQTELEKDFIALQKWDDFLRDEIDVIKEEVNQASY